jgi:hypothetical protein
VRLSAEQLDEMKLRLDEPDKLEREYCRWGARLADVLGVPIYAYSTKYRNGLSGGYGNIPRRH